MEQTNLETANDFIEQQLVTGICDLEACVEGYVLTFIEPLQPGADDLLIDVIELFASEKLKLSVVLEKGGYIETTERIADLFRHHYKTVYFIVPNFVQSAGTVLVMSGDAIYMDYYSILGPIDPQVQRRETGRSVPAVGY